MVPRGAKEWRIEGREARKRVPRSSLGQWTPSPDRRDPVDILIEQGKTRVERLLPLRYGRMLVSPFTFYRGAAAVMAADLASGPNTGLRAQLAGDAHLANFGGYASPERDFVFDVNDFDETLPGPFEWDLKRLVASFAVAGRDRGFSEAVRRKIALTVARTYREALAEFAGMTRLDVWYAHMDIPMIQQRFSAEATQADRDRFAGLVAKAQRKTSNRALTQLTEVTDGHLKLIDSPPLVVPIERLLPADQVEHFNSVTRTFINQYRRALQSDKKHLFAGYEFLGAAHKVVGVGSVGTRCWVILLAAEGDESDPLVLQMKQAEASVLEPYAGKSRARTPGQRVVEGQRLMQASSDIFLGWAQLEGIDGVQRYYYIRQLWDWKGSADLEIMDRSAYRIYARLCGWTLARAHARSGQRNALTSYVGSGDVMDTAMADFAEVYADQNELDHARMQQAADEGRIQVQTG